MDLQYDQRTSYFFIQKIVRFSDKVAEFLLNLWDVLQIRRAFQGFMGSPTELKNILWIHTLFYQCIVFLRGP